MDQQSRNLNDTAKKIRDHVLALNQSIRAANMEGVTVKVIVHTEHHVNGNSLNHIAVEIYKRL